MKVQRLQGLQRLKISFKKEMHVLHLIYHQCQEVLCCQNRVIDQEIEDNII